MKKKILIKKIFFFLDTLLFINFFKVISIFCDRYVYIYFKGAYCKIFFISQKKNTIFKILGVLDFSGRHYVRIAYKYIQLYNVNWSGKGTLNS